MGKLIRNGIEYGGGNGTDIFKVTQAEYDALVQAGTLVHNALYVISDGNNLNPTADDIEYSSGVTVKQAIDNRYTKTETDTELAKKCNYVDLGTGSIHDFLTNTNYPKGIYIVECMRSPDSPTVGYVSFAIIDKPQDAGGYSNIMVNGQGHLYSCLIPSTVPSTLTFNLMV